MNESPSPAAHAPQRPSIQETAQSAEAFQTNAKNESGSSGTDPLSPAVCAVDDALAEIDRILHQMLLLAEFSSIDANVDREMLQKVLERLKTQINQIADTIESG